MNKTIMLIKQGETGGLMAVNRRLIRGQTDFKRRFNGGQSKKEVDKS